MYQLAGANVVSLFLDSGSSEAYIGRIKLCEILIVFFYSFIGLKASTDGLLRGSRRCGGVYGGESRESRDPCQCDEPVCTDLRDPGSMDGGSARLGCELCDLVWLVSDRKMEECPRDQEVRPGHDRYTVSMYEKRKDRNHGTENTCLLKRT